jgi:Skp family chaperone for outer membrane proteins
VKKPLFSATIVASLVIVFCAAGAARAQSANVAIIDLGYIFKKHAGFLAAKEALRRDAEAADAELKAKRETMRKMVQKLETYNKGSAEYRQLEEELAKMQADLTVEGKLTQKSFIEREAKIYYEVYQHVVEEVKRYAESTGIVLVIPFNGDPPDKNNPEDTMRSLYNSVVYYHNSIDITPIIRDRLNGVAPRAGGPSGQFPTGARPGVPPRK